MLTGMDQTTEKSGQGLIVVEQPLPAVPVNGNGSNGLAAIESEPEFSAEDAQIARKYEGWRGWWRLLEVSRVIALLSLYLYLDRYDMHYVHVRRFAGQRLEKARQLGPLAVLQVRINGIGNWFFDRGVRMTRWFVYRGSHKDEKQQEQAVWLRDSLIKLGPTFIKLGQSLGTRADLLPLTFVKELGTLQDEVPPFDNAEAHARIEFELKRTLKEAFAEFDVDPIAAASLGQVYRARLYTGEEVAVKVQRPNLAATIHGDVALLRRIAGYAARYPKLNENADWGGMLHEFEETIQEEMDYVQEGRNAERFRHNFLAWQNIYVPKIHWSHTTKKVLTLEFIRGTKVIDTEALATRGLSAANANRLLIKTYLKQLLEDGFFHADPHPGNLLVMHDGRLAFFDFGMVGRITPKLQSKMIDAFFHVVSKDAAGIAHDLIELDFLKPGVDPNVVKPVVERLFQHYLNLKFKEVNFKELTYELADVMYDYPFRLPSNFTYIMRALMTLEGIGIRIDPEFNFFETAKPFAKEFTLRREGKQFRQLILDKLTGKNTEGDIDWSKMWKLAKMAVKAIITP
jgi:predicted unusual protein kinase regulating ubiquinone biosynthesis (AarF/ABC1/UbiB family)